MDDQILDDQARSDIPQDFSKPEPVWKNFIKKNKVIIASALAVVLIIGIFWFFLSRSSTSNPPQSQNVILLVKGPNQITSGNEAEYTVVYRNGENADLVGVSLEMLYPTGFKFKSATPAPASSTGSSFNLPILKQGEDGTVVIRGKLSGSTSEEKEIRARLNYRLSNFNSEFVVSESIHTTILAPNLVLDINGPVDVVNGQDTTFSVTITNVSGNQFENLAIQLVFPVGFSFTSSTIRATKNNNYWVLGLLETGNSQSLDITGSFTGADREEKLVRADLGQIISNNFAPQIVSTASFRVIPSSLALTITAQPQSYVKLGDTITYKLAYMNRGSIGLSNLVIDVTLNGPVLELSRVSASNAIINGSQLTWKAATLSNLSILSPNERGEITFTVPLKQQLTSNLKNQTIRASASISSDEITNPTRAGDSELKLISNLDLSITGDYVSGAAPMQVGQTTVFAMTLLLSNLSNDLINTEVVASIPLPSSAWKNVIIPDSESGRLSYDPNSGKIKWKIGDLVAFTGKFTPALKVTFQLAVTPTESDRGKTMTLLSDLFATGTDTFVNQIIESVKTSLVTVTSINDEVMNLKGTSVE
ncbi:MAG: hypothetical protein A3B10_04120 [Candidatus Doudnabacteria bacterium RIFCSPLOWO2_01_FULL_44_21]|uniref:DUF11 domain-containing protein n=1 Tax=Candidatus Doudnabacteria bacterium RIFCSPLOWO2_01_FULL_44_21 TaxID=1817841 RepID=A0A1F5Q535_9BACT|nr:MAG: hypothetical protein A3B95_00350 [Candidatus Doudnabacteria bacterium RIFCSPHIGHO2_02_FULL_43_13b]OGE97301.1 MAG: hypothetical protein A3B10_04120 [Candidatus Doudnabacteria bacterium RIFCSPLOWO2_01_FULL_44_21]